MAEYERRAVYPLNHVGHRESLAGTGYSKEGLRRIAAQNSLRKLINCLRLVARGSVC